MSIEKNSYYRNYLNKLKIYCLQLTQKRPYGQLILISVETTFDLMLESHEPTITIQLFSPYHLEGNRNS